MPTANQGMGQRIQTYSGTSEKPSKKDNFRRHCRGRIHSAGKEEAEIKLFIECQSQLQDPIVYTDGSVTKDKQVLSSVQLCIQVLGKSLTLATPSLLRNPPKCYRWNGFNVSLTNNGHISPCQSIDRQLVCFWGYFWVVGWGGFFWGGSCFSVTSLHSSWRSIVGCPWLCGRRLYIKLLNTSALPRQKPRSMVDLPVVCGGL